MTAAAAVPAAAVPVAAAPTRRHHLRARRRAFRQQGLADWHMEDGVGVGNAVAAHAERLNGRLQPKQKAQAVGALLGSCGLATSASTGGQRRRLDMRCRGNLNRIPIRPESEVSYAWRGRLSQGGDPDVRPIAVSEPDLAAIEATLYQQSEQSLRMGPQLSAGTWCNPLMASLRPDTWQVGFIWHHKLTNERSNEFFFFHQCNRFNQ